MGVMGRTPGIKGAASLLPFAEPKDLTC